MNNCIVIKKVKEEPHGPGGGRRGEGLGLLSQVLLRNIQGLPYCLLLVSDDEQRMMCR